MIFLSLTKHTGPIFLCRFKLYMFSFTFGFMFANICFEKNQNSKIYVMFIITITRNETGIGPIFLRRFRLFVLSFMFRFMFANICFEKNQNSKIYVMFVMNITWNETGICSFWAVWAVRAVGKNQVLTCASLVC